MKRLTEVLDQLLERDFVTAFLKENGYSEVRDQIPRRVLLTQLQIAQIESLLKPLPDHASIGLLGSYRQRLLICSDEFPPDPAGDEGCVSFEGVSFTFRKTPIPRHEWEWDVLGSRNWLDYRHEDMTWKQPGYDALSAYEEICRSGELTVAHLDTITECARTHYWVSWNIGTQYLSKLASNNNVARDAIFDMAKDRKARVRQRTVQMLSYTLPKSFCVRILRLHFNDRSKLVRDAAVYRTHVLHLIELKDDLRALLTTE